MSLPKERKQTSFFDVAFIADELFEEGSPYRIHREKVLPGLRERRPELAKLYEEENGRPAIEQVTMAGALLLQFMEKAPDRKAVSEMRLNLGWKYALDLRWDEGEVHPSSLTVFRRRLIGGGAERLVFDAVLERLQAEGLVKRRSKQRIDSTHVVAAVAHMCRLEVMWKSVRLCLDDVERAGVEERPEAWSVWVERYQKGEPDLRELREPGKMTAKQLETGMDTLRLLAWLEDRPEMGGRESVSLLRRVFAEQYEVVDGEIEVRRVELAGSGWNPHDPEAQWSAKDPAGRTSWLGYKAQVAETVPEDGKPRSKGEPTEQFVTGVSTTAGTASDQAGLREAMETQASQGLEPPPESRNSTSAWMDARLSARPERPPRPAVSCTTPAGTTGFTVSNGGNSATAVPCRWPAPGGRRRKILIVGIYHDAVQKRRREMKTESGRKNGPSLSLSPFVSRVPSAPGPVRGHSAGRTVMRSSLDNTPSILN